MEQQKCYLYGAGTIGRQIAQSVDESIKVLGFIDINYKMIPEIMGFRVYSSDILKTADYDKVILTVSVNNSQSVYEILNELHLLSVPWAKIQIGYGYKKKSVVRTLTPNTQSSWNGYYDIAEKDAGNGFNDFLKPYIDKYNCDLTNVLDFPSGRGRIAEQFKSIAGSVTVIDANPEAIRICAERFKHYDNYFCQVNRIDGNKALPLDVADNTFSFVYSFDAMVHFDYKWLDFYIFEFHRIVKNSGYVLIHHSNYGSGDIPGIKSNQWDENPHSRSNISKDDVAFIAKNHGFKIVEQDVRDWGSEENGYVIKSIDCITILQKI